MERDRETGPRVVVIIVDGLPLDLAEEVIPGLPFLGARLSHRTTAISCFPSTTGPAYFPFLAGCTPGRANIPGIRWFDRTRPTRSTFPHRGLRSYVGPDARKLATDTEATTLFARHAWPVSSPIPKDLPKHGELSRDLLWATAHVSRPGHGGPARARDCERSLTQTACLPPVHKKVLPPTVPESTSGGRTFAEPITLSSTDLIDFRLPATVLKIDFDLLASRTRRRQDTKGQSDEFQGTSGSPKREVVAICKLFSFPHFHSLPCNLWITAPL